MSNQARATLDRGVRPLKDPMRILVLSAVIGMALFRGAAADDAAPVPARGDLSADQAVKLSLERNKDLLISGENVDAASGIKKSALQAYLPRLSASGGFSRSLNPQSRFDPNSGTFINQQNNYGVRYVLTQNLIDLASLRNIAAAGGELAASKLDYSFSRTDLVLATKQQYYALLAAQELATVSDSALALSDRELQRTQSLFELGMVAKSDVLKAEVRVSSSKLDVIRDRSNVVLQRAFLSRIIGQEPTEDLRASDQLTETPVSVDSTAIFQDAVAHRADLQSALKNWQASKARASAARFGFFPTLAAQAQYSNGNPHGLQPFDGFAPDALSDQSFQGTRTVSLGISFPLFDGIVGKKGAIQTAAARAEQDRYAYERKQLDVAVEVRQAINSARQANEGIEVAKSGLASAEEDLKLSQEKYNVGSGTILELLDAQVNLQTARQQYVAALTQARIAEAQIERARGTIP
jgi:outer membrane protein